MDLASIIGMLVAVGLFGWALVSGAGDSSVVDMFVDTPSVILVVGGSIFIIRRRAT